MERRLSEIVRAEDEGLALGNFLRRRMGLSKKEISQAKFRENGICVDGRRQKVTAVLRAGQRVDVLLDEGERTSPQLKSSDRELKVLYEDQDVIAVDKPAGLSVHPAGREGLHGDTLANRLVFYLREKSRRDFRFIPPGGRAFTEIRWRTVWPFICVIWERTA